MKKWGKLVHGKEVILSLLQSGLVIKIKKCHIIHIHEMDTIINVVANHILKALLVQYTNAQIYNDISSKSYCPAFDGIGKFWWYNLGKG